MALNVPLLRSSFALVVDREPELTSRFYEVLFKRYPQARALFGRNTQAHQAQMLQQALIAVIEHLEDAPWLEQNLAALGRKHVEYGVTDEMYPWVGESLLATLAEIAGPQWSKELESAWSDAYGAVAELMLAGARRASP